LHFYGFLIDFQTGIKRNQSGISKNVIRQRNHIDKKVYFLMVVIFYKYRLRAGFNQPGKTDL